MNQIFFLSKYYQKRIVYQWYSNITAMIKLKCSQSIFSSSIAFKFNLKLNVTHHMFIITFTSWLSCSSSVILLLCRFVTRSSKRFLTWEPSKISICNRMGSIHSLNKVLHADLDLLLISETRNAEDREFTINANQNKNPKPPPKQRKYPTNNPTRERQYAYRHFISCSFQE